MKSSIKLTLALASAGILTGGAKSANYVFGGSATLSAGYGKNPSFDAVHNSNSAVLGGDLTAVLARVTGQGRTALTGSADVSQATGGGGRTENYRVGVGQAQQINAKLGLTADAGFSQSNNPGAIYSTDSRDLVPIGDILTIGTQTRSIYGDVNAAYQRDAKDLFQIGASASHNSFSRAGASAYSQYNGTFGYLRTVSSATRIGVQFSALKVASDQFSSSSSYSTGLALTQKIGRVWTFQGGVNGVLQKAFGGSFKTIGFNGSFCGDYPRLTVCVLGSRQSAASGIGGLRIDTQGSARVNYKISALSTVDLTTTYDISSAKDIALPTQHYVDAAVNYRRTITPRLSAGLSARYQRRTSADIGVIAGLRTVSYVGSANVIYSFGRTS